MKKILSLPLGEGDTNRILDNGSGSTLIIIDAEGKVKVCLNFPKEIFTKLNNDSLEVFQEEEKTSKKISRWNVEDDEEYEEEIERTPDEVLANQIPEGIDPSTIKYIERYPHYLLKGFDLPELYASVNDMDTYICEKRTEDGKLIARCTYIPIWDLKVNNFVKHYKDIRTFCSEKHVDSFTQLKEKYDETQGRLEGISVREQDELDYLNENHNRMLKALRNKPDIKGFWVANVPICQHKNDAKFTLELKSDVVTGMSAYDLKKEIKKLDQENNSRMLSSEAYDLICAHVIERLQRLQMIEGLPRFVEARLNIYRAFLASYGNDINITSCSYGVNPYIRRDEINIDYCVNTESYIERLLGLINFIGRYENITTEGKGFALRGRYLNVLKSPCYYRPIDGGYTSKRATSRIMYSDGTF